MDELHWWSGLILLLQCFGHCDELGNSIPVVLEFMHNLRVFSFLPRYEIDRLVVDLPLCFEILDIHCG